MVGDRPRTGTCSENMETKWKNMLIKTRIHIETMIGNTDSLLTEYRINLDYVLYQFETYDFRTVYHPPTVRSNEESRVQNLDHWLKETTTDAAQFNVDMLSYKLPKFLGTPCGVATFKQDIYILTTEGELFKLLIKDILDQKKCIVERPNTCSLERIMFDKTNPLISKIDPKNFIDGISPTCLLMDPNGFPLVVSHAHGVIYRIIPSYKEIKIHAGKEVVQYRTDMTDGDEKTATFRAPTCAVFDHENNLWVADFTKLRKITYESGTQYTKFDVETILETHKTITSMAWGPRGLVLTESQWSIPNQFYTSWLYDMQTLVYDPGYMKKNSFFFDDMIKAGVTKDRAITSIKDRVCNGIIGSILVDGCNHIVYAKGTLYCVDRAEIQRMSPPRWTPTRNRDDTQLVIMKRIELPLKSRKYLAWWRQQILLVTALEGQPILMFFSGSKKREADAAGEQEGAAGGAAGRLTRPRSSLHQLIRQLANL